MRGVGICGGSGAGKTSLAALLAARASVETCCVSQDWYYCDRTDWTPAQREKTSFDEPRSLELDRLASDLAALRDGRPIAAPTYCFKTHSRLAEVRRLEPAPIVIVEGTLIFSTPMLREILDYKVFLAADDDVRFIRRLRRDLRERGRSVDEVVHQYLTTVKPMHTRYVEPQREYADRVVDTADDFSTALVDECLADILGCSVGSRGRLPRSSMSGRPVT